jgi:hypothetical protein
VLQDGDRVAHGHPRVEVEVCRRPAHDPEAPLEELLEHHDRVRQLDRLVEVGIAAVRLLALAPEHSVRNVQRLHLRRHRHRIGIDLTVSVVDRKPVEEGSEGLEGGRDFLDLAGRLEDVELQGRQAHALAATHGK